MARGALLALCVAAVVFELRRRRIPDWLCAAGLAAGVIWNLEPSFMGAGVALMAALPFWVLRTAESRHVKLMTAVGAITGWLGALAILGMAILVLGVRAVVEKSSRRPIVAAAPVSIAVLGGAAVWAAISR